MKGLFALLLMLVLLWQPLFPLIDLGVKAMEKEDFHDIDNHWAKEDLLDLISKGLIQGVNENGVLVVKPNAKVTRAEFITVLVRSLYGKDELDRLVGEINFTSFSDTQNHWGKKYIEIAKKEEITSGYSDGSFKPNSLITRAEIVAMLVRAYKIEGEGDASVFSDVGKNHWAFKEIGIAANQEIVKGSGGKFFPNDQAKRAESMVMVSRTLKMIEMKEKEPKTDPEIISMGNKMTLKVKGNTPVKPNETVDIHIDGEFLTHIKDVTWEASSGSILVSDNKKSVTWKAPATGELVSKIKANIHLQKGEKEGKVSKTVDIDIVKIEGQQESSSPSAPQPFAVKINMDDMIITEYDGKDTIYLNHKLETLSGTVTGASALKSLAYTVKAGTMVVKEGTITPSAQWKIEELSLIRGLNTVTVTATDNQQKTASVSIQIDNVSEKNTVGLVLDSGDQDGDLLLNWEEEYYKTDPSKQDTDSDGLSDYLEIYLFKTDPLKADTDKNGVLDGNEDADLDILTNTEEIHLGSNPFELDTDGDGLNDGDEVKNHHTDLLMFDTDQDGLSDGSEVLKKNVFDTDPLNPDSDGDGILDGDEKVTQELESVETLDLGKGLEVSLSMDASGDLNIHSYAALDGFASEMIGTEGIVGEPIDLVIQSDFENAFLSFTYDEQNLNGINESDLGVFYFNPETQLLELVENQSVDVNTNKVTAQLDHFSTYLLGDVALWSSTWSKDSRPVDPEAYMHAKPLDIVFVIDSSDTMDANDPEDFRKEVVSKLMRESLLEDDRIAIVDMQEFASLIRPFTFIGPNESPARNDIKTSLELIDSQGGTNIFSGLDTAISHLEKDKRKIEDGEDVEVQKHIILLTDWNSHGWYGRHSTKYTGGEDGLYKNEAGEVIMYPTAEEEHERLMQRARKEQIRINTFLLNATNSVLESDRRVLKAIAAITGGNYSSLDESDVMDFVKRSYEEINKDSDGDGVPDQFETQVCYIRGTMGKYWEPTDPNNPDSDGDGLGDLEETGTRYYSPLTKKLYCSLNVITDLDWVHEDEGRSMIMPFYKSGFTIATDKINLSKLFAYSSLYGQKNLLVGKSNPNKADTDGDGKPDHVDQLQRIPFKPPIVMLHGICSNTSTAWGADTYLDNFDPLGGLCDSQDDGDGQSGDFIRDIGIRQVFGAEKISPSAQGYKYKKNDNIDFSDIDAQFIRDVGYFIGSGNKVGGKADAGDKADAFYGKECSKGSTGFYRNLAVLLECSKLTRNVDFFAFNWDAGNNIDYASRSLKFFLNGLEDNFFKKINYRDIYDEKGRSQFILIGHSAGGLVSRMYIENKMTNSDPNIYRLITVDTPHWGSNYARGFGNPGCVTEVLSDLDRDDSNLWYNYPQGEQGGCASSKSRGDNLKLNHPTTEYFFIGGINAYEWEEVKKKNGDGGIYEFTQRMIQIKDKLNSPKDLYEKLAKSNLPYLIKNGDKIENVGINKTWNEFCVKSKQNGLLNDHVECSGEWAFGDNAVSLASQMGIFSPSQKNKFTSSYTDHMKVVEAKSRFVVYGSQKRISEHSNIEHNPDVLELIYQLTNVKYNGSSYNHSETLISSILSRGSSRTSQTGWGPY